MCDAKPMFFGTIGCLRKQHEQIGETKRQARHYIECPQLFQQVSNLSELAKWETLQHHLWDWRWSPRPKHVNDVELWLGSPLLKFIIVYQYHIFKAWKNIYCYYMKRKHEKPTSAQGPSERRAHSLLSFGSPSAPEARWNANRFCPWPRPEWRIFTKSPTGTKYFNSTFGFHMEMFGAWPLRSCRLASLV